MSVERIPVHHTARRRIGERGILLLDDDALAFGDRSGRPVWSTAWASVHSVMATHDGVGFQFHVDTQRYGVTFGGRNRRARVRVAERVVPSVMSRATGRVPLGFEPTPPPSVRRLAVGYSLFVVGLVGLVIGVTTLLTG